MEQIHCPISLGQAVSCSSSLCHPSSWCSSCHPPSPPRHLASWWWGGDATATSVELWSPTSSCSLAPLPQPAVAPSVDVVEGEVVACHGTSCSTLSGGVWGEGAVLRESRRWHTTATTARGLLLMGGFDSPNTTEVVVEGQAAVGFPLHPGRESHCSIQVAEEATTSLT